MKYTNWFYSNSKGIRLNIVIRIAAGLAQTVLALLVVWMSKRLVDEVAITGTMREMVTQALLIALAVVAGVSIRQLNQYLARLSYIRWQNCGSGFSICSSEGNSSTTTTCTQETCHHVWPRTSTP